MDEASRVSRAAARVSWLRLAAAAAAIGCFVLALTSGAPRATAFLVASVVALAGFVLLVAYHDRLKARADDLAARRRLRELAAHRVNREWSWLPQTEWEPVPTDHAYAVDLDLFGSASLASLFPPMTTLGRRTVREWLLELPAPDVTGERQAAVAELREMVELCEQFAVRGLGRLGVAKSGQDKIAAWAADRSTIPTSLLATMGALLVVAAVLAMAQAEGWISGYWWLTPLAIGFGMSKQTWANTEQTIDALTSGAQYLAAWAQLARLVGEQPFRASLLRRLQDDLRHADDEIDKLHRLAEWAAVRESPMMHLVLRFLLYWDLWIAWLGIRWRQRNGDRVATWLGAISTCEGLAALATLARENPGWVFPTLLDPDHATFSARALGHPLLPAATRVTNDVSVGPEGTLLLVTGSNMAGKSTLLRAIGVNLVLARVGSAVCADALDTRAFRLRTVIRVQDSLERGVSYFLAELERLKSVVQAARAPNEAPLLYLFDEILQGTNSAERLIAARHVLQHLIAAGAVGVVTTHDLSLADVSEFDGRVHHVHLREQIESNGAGGRMTFDYRLRPGKATSTNALKLLELVGLGD